MITPMTDRAAQDAANPALRGRAEQGRRKRRQTRQRLVQAAFELLGQDTGWNVQIDEVVARAGVARGTFYNYFDSREHLINVMAFELNHGLDVALAHAPDPATRTALAVRAYLHKAATDRRWAWAMVNVSKNGRLVFGEDTYRHATETIEAGIASGDFKIPSLQAGLDLVMGSAFHAMRGICEGQAPDTHAEDVARLVLLGLGVNRTRVERLLRVPLSTVDIAIDLTGPAEGGPDS